MKLKVCGMRSEENIKGLISQINPHWMGLIFYAKSPRFVSKDFADSIKGLTISKVGVFVNANLDEIKKAISLFDLHTIQLHGDESVGFTKSVKEETGLEIFKVFSVKENVDWSELEGYLPYVDYFLFDTFTKGYGGSGKTFDWQILRSYPFEKPFLLSGGLSLENIKDIQKLYSEIPQLAGLDINSKFEIEPGFKDIDRIEEFWEKVRV
ncbi:phosphoribosylanthranilate isomerase [Belliella aquatica]|uniref:N-(5'-phosphoribosyl)anthranilate isomerase n=1 Tax=Belliella aquatica TaxID=1323734 RepID=A0ABQ1MDU4_9BACT|nr:phosphoribosylanthranilate isomerase [Belliella aquatica]MCH7405249.1 phosphoribosylanthranilate isomerase [Belliella aquatica]GGC38509.1 N-(5'-phosphoribosyl)anthranilate isomerase [Belliella aquatica]